MLLGQFRLPTFLRTLLESALLQWAGHRAQRSVAPAAMQDVRPALSFRVPLQVVPAVLQEQLPPLSIGVPNAPYPVSRLFFAGFSRSGFSDAKAVMSEKRRNARKR